MHIQNFYMMENTIAMNQNLQTYLKEIEDKSSRVMKEGFYPVNVVIDAFAKGEEYGLEKFRDEIESSFIRKATQMFLYGTDAYRDLVKKGYSILGAFVNPFDFKFVIITEQENTYNETFIEDFYGITAGYETKFQTEFSQMMRILFLHNNGLDEETLISEGFIKL